MKSYWQTCADGRQCSGGIPEKHVRHSRNETIDIQQNNWWRLGSVRAVYTSAYTCVTLLLCIIYRVPAHTILQLLIYYCTQKCKNPRCLASAQKPQGSHTADFLLL